MKYRPITFGDRVRDFRKAHGWNQSQLAERAQISRNYVALIEQDKARNISLAVFTRLARALMLEPASLLAVYLEMTE